MYFFELSERFTTKPWYFVLRGILNVVFGLSALTFSAITAKLLITLFALWMIANGIILIAPVLAGQTTRKLWRQTLVGAATNLAIGAFALLYGHLALYLAAFLLGGLLIFRSVLEITALRQAQRPLRHQRVLLLGIGLSVAAALVIVSTPFSGQYAFVKMFGGYATIIGIINILSAWRVGNEIMLAEVISRTSIARTPLVPIGYVSAIPRANGNSVDTPCEWIATIPGQRLNPSKYQRPLILAPHPDDLEAFVGGLVYKLSGDLVSVVFAGGDRGVWKPEFAAMKQDDYTRLRLNEAAGAAALLGIKKIIYMGFADREVKCTEEAVEDILAIFEQHQPDLIVSFEYYRYATPYPHPDHLASAEIVRRAVARYERRHCLDYLLAATLIPNVYLDVTGVRRLKLEALACHNTQAGLNGIIFPFLERLTTRLWGAFNGVDFAEGYRSVNIAQMEQRLDSRNGTSSQD